MEKFRFRFDKVLSDRTKATFGFDQHSPEMALSSELGGQIYEVSTNIKLAADKQGIGFEELHKRIQFVENAAKMFREDDEDDYEDQFLDLRLTRLIGYANALGGILKIHVELDNGDTVEFL